MGGLSKSGFTYLSPKLGAIVDNHYNLVCSVYSQLGQQTHTHVTVIVR